MKYLALTLATITIIVCAPGIIRPWTKDATSPLAQSVGANDPTPPATPVKLIFIHHSTGGNWLADPNADQPHGGLGIALKNNNYFVSATNYGWGPTWPDHGQPIGSFTDIIHWPVWFTSQYSNTILAALYTEDNQNICNPLSPSDDCFGDWSRLPTNPGGENEIIMFKSCFPNSDLYGNPDDPPLSEPDDSFTVANAKAVYIKILTYFATRQDKLFIVITAPPLMQSETAPKRAANARAFNNWLVNNWLDSYPHNNVAVFDYYNVLTSNGGNANANDVGAETGNHHRWWNGAVQHIQTVANNDAAYPSGDSHPTTAGHQKATAEFVPLLNIYYNRWRGGGAPCVALTGVNITGPTNGYTDTQYAFTAGVTPANASMPITYTWTPGPASGPGTATARYIWPTVGTKTITLTAQNCGDNFADTHTITIQAAPSGALVQPEDFNYLGAFRLPGGDEPPQTFAYGGNAMTYNPDNNTLFISGHDRIAYGTLPDGDQIAEVSIPTPLDSRNVDNLPIAGFVQDFDNPTAGYFTDMEEIPKIGLQYLNHHLTGPKLHLCWGQHLQEGSAPSHAWFNATLATPNLQGVWYLDDQPVYSVNGYLFDIPTAWADAHAQGRYLASGRMRDGGQGGMGPTLFAYRPWLSDGSAPVSGTHLAATTLLLYENTYNTEEITRCLEGYQHPDEWEGGAWITTPSGKSAVLFAGTKSTGAKYWYGFINPAGAAYPCVDMHADFTNCRLANGSPCSPEDLTACCEESVNCISERGWWSTRFDAQFILYDPTQLARVAAGQLEPWQPQPYARVDIDNHLYLNPPEWDRVTTGWGDQRRYRIGDAAYDRVRGRLYVLELYADGGKPVVHVWQIQ